MSKIESSQLIHRKAAAGVSLCLVVIAIGLPQPARAAAPGQAGYLAAPKAFRAAARKVMPSVVSIEAFGGIRRPKAARGGQVAAFRKPGDGPTTGLIISPDGYVITSTYNFLNNPPVVIVVLPDGTQHVAELRGADETRKLCLLKIEQVKDLPVPEFVPRSELKVGQWAVSIGVGYGGRTPAISAGIISATSRIYGKAVQTDANTSPACYGGPLVDLRGRVIGVCVPLAPGGQGVDTGAEWYDSGIGFAVPLAEAGPLIEELKAGKTLVAGRLGIQPKPGASQGPVVIAQVAADSPAAKAGLVAGDEIVSAAGERLLDITHLRLLVGGLLAGDKLSLAVKREDEELQIEVTLDAGAEPALQPPAKAPPK